MTDNGTLGLEFEQTVSLPTASVPVGVIGMGGQVQMSKEWYIYHETMYTRTGGTTDKVNAVYNAPVGGGQGIQGDGTVGTGLTISIEGQSGWTFGTGTTLLGAFATYGGQTWGTIYSQSVAQTLDNTVMTLSQRVLALEQALIALGAITE